MASLPEMTSANKNRHYLARLQRPHEKLNIHKNMKLYDAIMEKVKKDPKTGCWNWQMQISHGYGMKVFLYKNYRVHRLIWEILNGPTDLFICHHCDNRACCNPEHLFKGTNTDNVRDMWAKGRGYAPGGQHQRGESHPYTKLTEKKVLEVKRLSKLGLSDLELSKILKINRTTIYAIRIGRNWGWLKG